MLVLLCALLIVVGPAAILLPVLLGGSAPVGAAALLPAGVRITGVVVA